MCTFSHFVIFQILVNMLTKAAYSRKIDISWSDLYLLCNLIYIYIYRFIYMYIYFNIYIFFLNYIYIYNPKQFKKQRGSWRPAPRLQARVRGWKARLDVHPSGPKERNHHVFCVWKWEKCMVNLGWFCQCSVSKIDLQMIALEIHEKKSAWKRSEFAAFWTGLCSFVVCNMCHGQEKSRTLNDGEQIAVSIQAPDVRVVIFHSADFDA